MHESRRYPKGILARPAALLAVAVLAAAPFLHNAEVKAQPADAPSSSASSASKAGGTSIVASWQAQPPALSSQRLAALRAAFGKSNRSGPTNLRRAAMAASGPVGPGQRAPVASAAAPGDFFLFDRIVSPRGASFSPVGEPSADNAGTN